MAVFGNTGHPQRYQLGRVRGQGLAQKFNLAALGATGAAEQLGQRHLAVARDTGNGHDLAGAHGEIQVIKQRVALRVVQAQVLQGLLQAWPLRVRAPHLHHVLPHALHHQHFGYP